MADISVAPDNELGEHFWQQQLGLPLPTTQHMEVQEGQQQQESTELSAALSDIKPVMLPVKVYRSVIFSGHQGKGSFDPWDAQLESNDPGTTFEIKVPATATCRDVQKHLAAVLKVAETPEQCLLWAVNASIDISTKDAPHLQRKHGDVQLFVAEYGEGLLDGQRLWLHVVPSSKLDTCSHRT